MGSLRGVARWAGLVVLVVAVACSSDGSGEGGSAAEEAEPASAEWVRLGEDLGNGRAALDETTVGPDNVADLEPVWEIQGLLGVTATPLVADDVVYFGDWTGHVHAVEAGSGEPIWDAAVTDSYIFGSVALDGGRVYVGTSDRQVVALDLETGEQLWETAVSDHALATIYGSPIVVDGKVLVGVGSFELMTSPTTERPTFRGSLVALDAASGQEVWRYWTTRGDATEGPGVSVWSSPAVDLARGEVYIGTGNTYVPPPSPRADGIVALDLATGAEKWVHQFTVGDTWRLSEPVGSDSDIGAPPNLLEVGGTAAVGAGDKAGWYRALDRATGEELWAAELTEGSVLGAVLGGAARAEGTIFVASNRGAGDADLIALDEGDGSERWRTDVEGRVTGPVSWANGVVYVADDTGRINAFDAADGERSWFYDTPNPAAGGISIVNGTVFAPWGWSLPAVAPPVEDPDGGIIAFRVGGSSGDDEAAAADGDGDGGAGADDTVDGEEVYQQSCAACHGDEGQGGRGPSLEGITDRMSLDRHLEVVRDGRGNMPGWEGSLTPEEIRAVVDYERTVLSPGDQP